MASKNNKNNKKNKNKSSSKKVDVTLSVEEYNNKNSDKLRDICLKLKKDIAGDNCYFFWITCFFLILLDFLIMGGLKNSIELLKKVYIEQGLAVEKNVSSIPSSAAYAVMQLTGIIVFGLKINKEDIRLKYNENVIKVMFSILGVSVFFASIVFLTFGGAGLYINAIFTNVIIFFFMILTAIACLKSDIYIDRFIPAILLFLIHVILGSFEVEYISHVFALSFFIIVSLFTIIYHAWIVKKLPKINKISFLKIINRKQYVCIFSLFIVLGNPFLFAFFMCSFFARNLKSMMEDVGRSNGYEILKSCVDILINLLIITITYWVVNEKINGVPIFSYIFMEMKNVF